AELLEVVVDWRHAEHALAGEFERYHLDDHRDGLDHEQPADNGKHDLVLGDDRDGSDETAERERAGVAHEDRGGGANETQKTKGGAPKGAAQHTPIARAGDGNDLQIYVVSRLTSRPQTRHTRHSTTPE